MTEVIVSKTEYEQLKGQAESYRKLASRFFELLVKSPIEEVVEDFRLLKRSKLNKFFQNR